MRILCQSAVVCALVLLACESPLDPTSRIHANVKLGSPVVALGDSVAFIVEWTNRSSDRVELVAPISYDVRLVAPDGTLEFVRAGRNCICLLTPDLVVGGKATQTWSGFWHPRHGPGTYHVDAGWFTTDGRKFVSIGTTRSFVAE
jgi:hypothetical protein